MEKVKWAPKEIFDQILEWSVIPTIDLILEVEDRGIILVKRTIAPYKSQWALPGLRMLKGENINDTIQRIAFDEVGVKLGNKFDKLIIGQYVGKFTTEHHRQDLSTGYYIKLPPDIIITLNSKHFSDSVFVNSENEIPKSIGAMYRYYLNVFFGK